jgi:hypothetical protein
MSQRRNRGVVLFAVAAAGMAIVVILFLGGRVPSLNRAVYAVSSAVVSPSSLGAAPDADAGGPDAAFVPRKQAGPLSSAQLGAPLVNGRYVTACGAPDTMKVTVKATVKMGHPVAVDVKTDPPDPAIAACVEKSVRDQQWDISPKAGKLTVRY